MNFSTLGNGEKAIFSLRSLYETYGYTQYKMSKFEEYDLYVRNKNFLISDNIITFTDTNGKLMALKPDVTLSIIKNINDAENVRKVYYNENVYRVSGGSRSFKEIMQVGLECVGDVDKYRIAEVLSLAIKSLAEISSEYVLDISNLDILSLLIEKTGVSKEGKEKIVNCIKEKNTHDIDKICEAEGIDTEKALPLKKLVDCRGDVAEIFRELYELLPKKEDKKLVSDFEQIISILPKENVKIDFSVINDMNYYNGIVFQGFVKGIPAGILSGGQYDNLMRKMGKKSDAVGFAVYLDQLETLEKEYSEYDVDTVIVYGDKTPIEKINETVEKTIASGKSVNVLKTVSDKLKYRELVDITK